MEFVTILLCCSSLMGILSEASGTVDGVRLYDGLLFRAGYNKKILPARSNSDVLEVDFGMSLTSLVDVQWKDYRLAWEPSEYGGLTLLRIPASEIWTPDIVPYNGAMSRYETMFDSSAVVYNSGVVLWKSSVKLSTFCPLDLTYFPRDTQMCNIKYGSWAHDAHTLKLGHYEGRAQMDLSDHDYPSIEWTLVNHTANINSVFYPCCSEPYLDLTYTLTLRRRSGYLTCVFVAPAVIMGLLVPVMFILPSESGEKITFGGILLLCDVLLLMMLDGFLPHAHLGMPLLGYYYVVCMAMTSFSLATSAFITSIWYRSLRRRPLPGPVRTVVLGLLGRLLFVTKDDVMDDASASVRFQRRGVTGEPSASVEADDKERMVHPDSGKVAASEWCQLAAILDRLCFVIFLASMVFITASVTSEKQIS